MQTSTSNNINMPASIPRNRGIAFNSSVGVRLIPTCKDKEMTNEDMEDICATWYSRGEVKSLQDGVLDDLGNMREGMPENDSMTYRGIEHLATPELNQARKFRRRAYVNAVLIEQYRQWNKNDSKSAELVDQNAISMAASCLSLNDGLNAIIKAKKDEEVAKIILSKTDRTSSDVSPASSAKRSVYNSNLDFFGAKQTKRMAVVA